MPQASRDHIKADIVLGGDVFPPRPWQYCLDPNCSMPPLTSEEIVAGVTDVAHEAGISDNDSERNQKLKGAFALRMLDDLVGEMQVAYAEVTASYVKLKKAFSG